MSTRAQICLKRDTPGFKETGGIYIYKHSDGYPKGVMPVLSDIVSRFHKGRGNDPSYLLCQIVRSFAVADKLTDSGEYSSYYEFLGWGLDCAEHGDIEYLYEIDSATGNIYINGKEAK